MANLQEDSKNPDSRLIPTTVNHNTDLHKEKAETQDARGSRGCRGWGTRHTVVVLATLGIVIDYMLQTVLAVTIVAMVGQNTTREEVEGDVCPLPVGHNITEEIRAGVFEWDERTQGMIQGSIYYGCAIVSLPAGRIAETYGATRVFGAMVAVGCLLCLVSPVAAQASTSLFVALRVMQGVTVGGLFPALNTLLVKWIPSEEISKVFSITHTGMNLGSVTCMALAGWLCEMEWLGGWPLPFYLVGAAGLVWYALWFLLVHPTPEEHPRITQKELQYILDGRRRVTETKKFPWGPFLRSPAVWVQTMTTAGDTFSLYIVLTMLPTFLTNIQHLSLRNAGVIAALPYLLSCLVSVGWGHVIGYLTAAHILTTRRIRQLSTGIAFYVSAGCMLGMCLVECDAHASVTLLVVCVCIGTCNYTGHFSSMQDLSPTFCGTLMGFVSIFSSLSGMAGPLLTGLIINENQTLGAWRSVFITSAIVSIVCSTTYILFTPVQRQHWDTAASITTSSSSSPCHPRPSPEGSVKAAGDYGVRV